MKYILPAYGHESAWTEQERADGMKESAQLAHDLYETGQYIDAAPLHPVTMTTSLHIRAEQRLITDGPFAETHEQLGGYYLIKATHLDETITVAARIPATTQGTIKIRPIVMRDDLPEMLKK